MQPFVSSTYFSLPQQWRDLRHSFWSWGYNIRRCWVRERREPSGAHAQIDDGGGEAWYGPRVRLAARLRGTKMAVDVI